MLWCSLSFFKVSQGLPGASQVCPKVLGRVSIVWACGVCSGLSWFMLKHCLQFIWAYYMRSGFQRVHRGIAWKVRVRP